MHENSLLPTINQKIEKQKKLTVVCNKPSRSFLRFITLLDIPFKYFVHLFCPFVFCSQHQFLVIFFVNFLFKLFFEPNFKPFLDHLGPFLDFCKNPFSTVRSIQLKIIFFLCQKFKLQVEIYSKKWFSVICHPIKQILSSNQNVISDYFWVQFCIFFIHLMANLFRALWTNSVLFRFVTPRKSFAVCYNFVLCLISAQIITKLS